MRRIKQFIRNGGVMGRGWALPALALAVVILVGSAPVAWSQVPTSARDYVLVKVADLAKETGNADLASQLLSSLSLEGDDEAFGATSIRNDPSQTANFNTTCLMDEDRDATLCNKSSYQSNLFTTTTPVSWQNKTGEVVWVGPLVGNFFGTPSSSLYISAGTSTVSGVAYNNTSEPRRLVDRLLIATSSASNPIIDSQYGFVTSDSNGAATGTSKWLPVRPNEYFLVFFRTQDPRWAVTSTNDLGLDSKSWLGWESRIFSTTTPRSP